MTTVDRDIAENRALDSDRTMGIVMAQTIEVEIERNYAAFVDIMPTLLADREGQYALLRDQQLRGVYATAGEAERAGYSMFRDELYSIQLVSNEPVDLGFFSHALSQG